MTINRNDDYEKLASILYPSIEASGNVYYGQTRKLAMDEILGKNNINFESHIETFNTDHGYDSYFNWKIGPLHGAIRTNTDSVINVSTFCYVDKIELLDDTHVLVEQDLYNNFRISGTSFAKYKIKLTQNVIENELSSGKYNTYEKNPELVLLGIVVTNEISPVDYTPISDRNFYVDDTDNTLYVKICDGFVNNNAEYNSGIEIYKPLTLKAIGGDVSVTVDFYAGKTESWNNEYIVEYVVNNSLYKNISSKETIELKENDIVQFICVKYAKRSVNKYINFEFNSHNNGVIKASGNINSLLSANFENINDLTDYGDFIFYNLLKNTQSLINAAELKLPAINLTPSCYCSMFNGCTALKEAPELPATTLAARCYSSMFNGCTSLIGAPKLPATILADYCYISMFRTCTSLKEAPELPATTLVDGCYSFMFNGCINLNNVVCHAKYIGSNKRTYKWLVNTKDSGTFYSSYPSIWEHNDDGIPANWNIVNINSNSENPLCFTNVNNESSSVTLNKIGNISQVYKYSTDNITYNDYEYGTEIQLANNGDKVYFKNSTNSYSQQSLSDYIHFEMTGKIKASGNINSLLSNNFESITDLTEYGTLTFSGLFENALSLIDAAELKLPATNLVNSCYISMFFGCTGLTTAPELPATNLASGCYFSMFMKCTSLKEMPELPATTLVDGCYHNMFHDCTSLKETKELPATVLVGDCYNSMFYGCKNLNKVVCYAIDASATNCTSDWLNKVSSKGEFCTIDNDTFTQNSATGIPTNWTIGSVYNINNNLEKPICFTNLDYRPSGVKLNKTGNISVSYKYSTDGINYSNYIMHENIPLNNYNDKVYFVGTHGSADVGNKINFSTSGKVSVSGNINSLLNYNFKNITDLTEYGGHTFYRLFASDATGHISLADISELKLPSTTLAGSCYESMFYNCTDLKKAPKLPATNLASRCYFGMFNKCTSLLKAPELPATTLADSCYCDMFSGCTSLKETPELNVKTLVDSCYRDMFNGCTNLNKVVCYAINISDSFCTYNWLKNVSEFGAFYTISPNIWEFGESGIPTNWYVNSNYNNKLSQPINNEKLGLVITSGADSVYNARGKLNESTKFNMLQYNPFLNGKVLPDTYNDYDGSYNQEIWGYKCFNSPVSFRNGIYGEYGSLTTFNDNSYKGIQLSANIENIVPNIKLCINKNKNSVIKLNADIVEIDKLNVKDVIVEQIHGCIPYYNKEQVKTDFDNIFPIGSIAIIKFKTAGVTSSIVKRGDRLKYKTYAVDAAGWFINDIPKDSGPGKKLVFTDFTGNKDDSDVYYNDQYYIAKYQLIVLSDGGYFGNGGSALNLPFLVMRINDYTE